MAKKPSPLKNRLARQVNRRNGVVAAALLPTNAEYSLPEVVWRVLSQTTTPLAVSDAAALAVCLTADPAFGSEEATGWVAGILGGSLVFPELTDPLADPRLRALDDDVIAALGPDAVWLASGEHPLPAFRPRRGGSGGWSPIIDATFDRVLAARGNGYDLVLAKDEED